MSELYIYTYVCVCVCMSISMCIYVYLYLYTEKQISCKRDFSSFKRLTFKHRCLWQAFHRQTDSQTDRLVARQQKIFVTFIASKKPDHNDQLIRKHCISPLRVIQLQSSSLSGKPGDFIPFYFISLFFAC